MDESGPIRMVASTDGPQQVDGLGGRSYIYGFEQNREIVSQQCKLSAQSDPLAVTEGTSKVVRALLLLEVHPISNCPPKWLTRSLILARPTTQFGRYAGAYHQLHEISRTLEPVECCPPAPE